jgi:hypothetical protein
VFTGTRRNKAMTLSELLTAIDKHNQIAPLLKEKEHHIRVYIDGIELANTVVSTKYHSFSNRQEFFKSVREEYLEPCAKAIMNFAHTEDLQNYTSENTGMIFLFGYAETEKMGKLSIHVYLF